MEMDWYELAKEIEKISPDVVAITSLTPTIEQALETARITKSILPESKVILGGYHPTFTFKELLENEFLDVIIMEKENTLF